MDVKPNKSGWVINEEFVYNMSRSERHAEQTRVRAWKKREATLMAHGKHPSQERAKYDAIMQERRGLKEVPDGRT